MQRKQRKDLVAVNGSPLLLAVTSQDKYVMDVLKEQLREVDSCLRPNKDEREQCEKSRNPDIPARLAADKGHQLTAACIYFHCVLEAVRTQANNSAALHREDWT